MNAYKSKYVPPSNRAGPQYHSKQYVSNTANTIPKALVINETNFPCMPNAYNSSGINKKKNKGSRKQVTLYEPTIPIMNFKQVAEAVKDLPDPVKIVEPPKIIEPEQKEMYDLTPYVRLQERRQAEYDYLYGDGAFINDKLNYERFSEASETSESSSEEEEDDLMDY